jgi:hypothetical protein
MKLTYQLLTPVIISWLMSSIPLRAESSVINSFEPTQAAPGETYLGAIPYHGGLMERGLLTLTAPQDLKFLRFEAPTSCDTSIFEAGTVTEGIADLAQSVGQNKFSVDGGRGVRARSVFVSINGAPSAGCAVLVFKLDTLPSTPERDYAFTCLKNMAPNPVPGNVLSGNWSVPFTIAANEVSLIRSDLLPDGAAPFVSLAFDADATLGYYPVTMPIRSAIMTTPDCAVAPLYQFVLSADLRRLELVRQH